MSRGGRGCGRAKGERGEGAYDEDGNDESGDVAASADEVVARLHVLEPDAGADAERDDEAGHEGLHPTQQARHVVDIGGAVGERSGGRDGRGWTIAGYPGRYTAGLGFHGRVHDCLELCNVSAANL